MGEKVTLGEVPETLLWTLYFRVTEARRPDTVLPDPVGVELLDRIDFPFAERFGVANSLQAQAQALRARRFDEEIRRFLDTHPDGTVVALGEGLETQFWRVDNGRARWLSVDLPESLALRRRLLPASSRQRTVACSALDGRWIDDVDPTHGVLVTAQGLLMYLHPAEVHQLIVTCAKRLPGAALIFDAVPVWFSARTVRGMRNTAGYRAPPMPWGLDRAEHARLAALPGVASLRELRFPRGRGVFFGTIAPLLGSRLPRPLRYLAPWTILRADFA